MARNKLVEAIYKKKGIDKIKALVAEASENKTIDAVDPNHYCTALEMAAVYKENKEVVSLLLEGKADVNASREAIEVYKNTLEVAMVLVASCTAVQEKYRWGYIWKKLLSQLPDVQDAVVDIARSVVLAYRVKQALEHKEEGYNLEVEERWAKKKTLHTLFSNVPLGQVIAFSKLWHRHDMRNKLNKERDYGGQEWVPLFTGPFFIPLSKLHPDEEHKGQEAQEGFQLVSLNSAAQLKEEGTRLNHCVGSYASDCINGKIRIVSIRNREGGPLSTIEMQLDRDSQHITIKQHRGKNNTEPTALEKKALTYFLDQVKRAPEIINWEQLKAPKKQVLTLEECAIATLGFDISKPGKLAQVTATYHDIFVGEAETRFAQNFNTLLLTRAIPGEVVEEIESKEEGMQGPVPAPCATIRGREDEAGVRWIERIDSQSNKVLSSILPSRF